MDEKTCVNCKYFDKEEYELPCRYCKANILPSSDRYEFASYMWEAKDKVSEPDSVNHPSHYCQDGSMEAIDEMIAVFGVESVKNFCLLNVWKYRKRAIFKNGEEDLKKSDWYMNKFVELNGRG